MKSGISMKIVNVFTDGQGGGNPAPIAMDASGLSGVEMQSITKEFGLESGFILPPPSGSKCDFEIRYFVPNHEMAMCGHVTVGALWLLHKNGKLARRQAKIWTKSGIVFGRLAESSGAEAQFEITQPLGKIGVLPHPTQSEAEILDVLQISKNDLAPFPIQNAATSRVKTLIPLKNTAILDALQPDFTRIESLCERIDSTGLYPYAPHDRARQIYDARQFPKNSGYPEDAATGIAASALAFGLLENQLVEASDRLITIRQGRAMNRPSKIDIRFTLDDGKISGCWLGGLVEASAER
ncbi:PhzF family phenazine biosynthesis protein [Acetobacter sacchari]|uniref:PhzF family phenazine biosynthesis protein n=1 Tax=Acetobacter sacchari TaxID=2661687 RepID=A0ABS3LSI4_9PROT|nr:PhzF family phenazine biosynthesis protein [Acetobacter sacchari]MBO1358864.1 PhzF family phenazine biosynthesis protein [Acetobacter sacchari]